MISVWKGAAVCYLYNSLSTTSPPPPSARFTQGGKEGWGGEMVVTVRAKADNGKVNVSDTAATATQALTRIRKRLHTDAQQQLQRHCHSSTLHLGRHGCTPLRVPPFVPSSVGTQAPQWRAVPQATIVQSDGGRF